MKKFMSFMDRYILPVASKMGGQRHLVAIRDAFITIIPLTILGSLATLINNAPIKALGRFLTENTFGQKITELNNDLAWGTLSIMALLIVISVSYNLAKSYKENGLQAALIATSIFVVMIPSIANIKLDSGETISQWGFIAIGYMGTKALFTSIIVGMLATEIFVRLCRCKKLIINMPEGVPPAVSTSFAKLLPGMITVALFAIISLLIKVVFDGSYVTDLINTYLGMPLKGVTNSLGAAIVFPLIIHLLWFLGLHGGNITTPFTSPLLLGLGAENVEMLQQGAKLSELNIVAGPFFDAFVYMGGSGVVIGLIIAIAIASKKRRKDMLALGLAPALFNINEPVMFGLPVVLNPIFGIPFILAPIVTSIVSYFAIASGIVSPVIVATIPWTTPPILGGFMATGHWSGAALSCVNIIISILIYLPFVSIGEKVEYN